MGAMTDFAGMRRPYERGELDLETVAATWHAQLRTWFDEAVTVMGTGSVEVNAMQLATADAAGRPSVRTVLVKGFDERGLVFYTNYDSAKARDLDARPYAAGLLLWPPLERQVRISGPVVPVSRAETEEYFAGRPRGSQLGAWASQQSQVVASRAVLDDALAAVEERFAGQVIPAPPNWGGYVIAPDDVEFWQGRANRMHDRIRYRLDHDAWVIERLAP